MGHMGKIAILIAVVFLCGCCSSIKHKDDTGVFFNRGAESD